MSLFIHTLEVTKYGSVVTGYLLSAKCDLKACHRQDEEVVILNTTSTKRI